MNACPVVLEGAACTIPAFTRWTPEYLKNILGSSPALVRMSDGKIGTISFSAFLDYLADPSSFTSSRGTAYLTDYYIQPSFADPVRMALQADVRCPLPRDDHYVEWITIYAGPARTLTTMHQDVFSTHTWLAELQGSKTWRLCPPDSTSDGFDAFGLAAFPCDVYEAILEPGDVIYVPPDWWHQVSNHKDSTLALSGNFCTPEHARSIINGIQQGTMPDTSDKWVELFTMILQDYVDHEMLQST